MVPNYLSPKNKMMFIVTTLGTASKNKRSKYFEKKKACFFSL
jgi:hypothetical protein